MDDGKVVDAGVAAATRMITIGGAAYLRVVDRLVWLRTVDPGASIETDAVELTDDRAVFRCVVRLTTGGIGSGYGSCTAESFGDFVEKAETKAIGRALGSLGFGTASAFDEGSRFADAPVRRTERVQTPRYTARKGNRPTPARTPVLDDPGAFQGISSQQIAAIRALAKSIGRNAQSLDALALERVPDGRAICDPDTGEVDWLRVPAKIAGDMIRILQNEKRLMVTVP